MSDSATAAAARGMPVSAVTRATTGTTSGNNEDEPPHLFATASDGEAFVKTQCQELRRDAAVLFILPVACVCSPTTFQSPLDVPTHRCKGTSMTSSVTMRQTEDFCSALASGI